MAVAAFIERFKTTSASRDPSDQDLGLDVGLSQASFSAPKIASVGTKHLDNPDLAFAYLQEIYKPLKRHYDWFRRTQRGQVKQYSRKARSKREAYRWRGRTPTHILTSGMDDYPRGPPHAGELHVDLISWVAFFTRTMRDVAAFLGEKDDEATFVEIEKAIIGNIDGKTILFFYSPSPRSNLDNSKDLHWDEEQKMYCDLDVNDDGTWPSLFCLLSSDEL